MNSTFRTPKPRSMETHNGIHSLGDDQPEEDFHVPAPKEPVPEVSEGRIVNLILDHSAFVRGIGNVKRWFNKDFIRSQLASKASAGICLNIYIPSYTLHEFDYVKKGTSILASNAREAIKFIDQIFEGELEGPAFGANYVENFDGNTLDQTPDEYDNPLKYNVYIEHRTDLFPDWNQCLQFQLCTPKIKEFPNHKTKFQSNVWRTESHGEDNRSQERGFENPDEEAAIPARLKHLIRSCVFKRCTEPRTEKPWEQWKLVTEDPITKVWARSFGVDCLNVNEAELLIFHSQDITTFTMREPGADFNAETDMYDSARGNLHLWIDTTSYKYEKLGKDDKRPRNQKKKNKRHSDKTTEPTNPDVVKEELFNMINYAPRSKGKLWTPASKSQPKNTEGSKLGYKVSH